MGDSDPQGHLIPGTNHSGGTPGTTPELPAGRFGDPPVTIKIFFTRFAVLSLASANFKIRARPLAGPAWAIRMFMTSAGYTSGTHQTGCIGSRLRVRACVTRLLRWAPLARHPSWSVSLSRKNAALGAWLALLLIGLHSPASSAGSQWLEVPFVHQLKAGCGSAAVAMVMQYWASRQPGLDAVAADAERIDEVLLPGSAKGIQGQALKRYLEEHGFAAFVFSGEIRDLQQHLAKGRPVVVSLALNGSRAPLHYVVVIGLKDKAVLVNDPARGKLIDIDLARFLLVWKATGNWALLAVPRTNPQPVRQHVQ
ncbi:MAG: peptidase family [Bryobacterales bacterium]|nr:peptidase family [Bryobacterales bacterium]